ncbi:MAG TPA: low molecular weight protein arginine phosphatase [Lentisphaeria bacterium]|nr:low molecular weight protein arginine phosphatase [Lentisphaeria bacterium]
MKILFVCTGNTCRSPMAEAYFRSLCEKAGRDDIEVSSAGTFAGGGDCASQQTVAVMKDYGIDVSGHRSRMLSMDMVTGSDLIITMTDSHRQHIGSMLPAALKKTRNLLEFVQKKGNISDPFGGTEKVYGDCFCEMKEALDNLFLEVIGKKDRTAK